MASWVQRSASQHQQKMPFDPDDQVGTVALNGADEELGLAAEVAVHENFARLVLQSADVHGSSAQIDSAVVSMLAGLGAHGSPPGRDEWVALSSFLPKSGKARRGPAISIKRGTSQECDGIFRAHS